MVYHGRQESSCTADCTPRGWCGEESHKKHGSVAKILPAIRASSRVGLLLFFHFNYAESLKYFPKLPGNEPRPDRDRHLFNKVGRAISF